MNLSKVKKNGLLVVRVSEERLDARVADRFKEFMKDVLEGKENEVLVDLAQVSFIDSSGLGSLVFGLKRVGRDGIFALCGLNKAIENLLSLTRLDTVFKVYATEDDAFEDLAR